ncbi:hypothetical protein CUJ83_07415 [Methanocella sp. CWC-04]|uniref:Dolichol kinase n=1 Tax=Methanooceanicella nereidis TaxID=2052831 RepID=A0AAP2RC39_9EURY|nr:hypothetical protein [Methanocella sp. CWC-04]MCD1294826.1 hypothetical protein [Methanocella sp. CWC-04]
MEAFHIIEPRKLVHISGTAFVFIALYSAYISIALISLGLAVFIALELAKRYVKKEYLSILYRDGEMKGCAFEPFLYLVSIAGLLVISLYYAPEVCYASIIVLTLGDGVASTMGKKFGRRKLPYTKKTLAGTVSGIIVSSAVGYFFVGPLIFIGSIAGMITEAYAGKLENLWIPVAAFLSMALIKALWAS